MHDTQEILKLSEVYLNQSQTLIKEATISKLPNGKYRVLSMKGKNLGTYDSHEAAKKRLKQVEYFKHIDKSNADDEEETPKKRNTVKTSPATNRRQHRMIASDDEEE